MSVISIASYPRQKDPAVEARRPMQAASDDDAAYGSAAYILETCLATTLAGIHAQIDRLCSYFAQVADGATLTDDGWGVVASLESNINRALTRLTARTSA